MRQILFTLTVFCSFCALAADYKYNELKMKDYDEMQAMVQSMVKKAREAVNSEEDGGEIEAIEYLREALKLIFSRPNQDNMVAKLVPEVRRDLITLSAFEGSISALASESLDIVKNGKGSASVQSTSLFVLENILSEVQPEIGKNADLRQVVERIRDAGIKVSTGILKDRKLKGMFKTQNPSDQAREMLKPYDKKKKNNKA